MGEKKSSSQSFDSFREESRLDPNDDGIECKGGKKEKNLIKIFVDNDGV